MVSYYLFLIVTLQQLKYQGFSANIITLTMIDNCVSSKSRNVRTQIVQRRCNNISHTID